jgi:hypothetical protein
MSNSRCHRFLCESNHCGSRIIESVITLVAFVCIACALGGVWYGIDILVHGSVEHYMCIPETTTICFFLIGIGTEFVALILICIIALVFIAFLAIKNSWEETTA